jgi:hypothetical protein
VEPVPAAPTAPHPVELTTLRILRQKNVLTEEEYQSALKDLASTTGALASESPSVVVGKWATTLYGFGGDAAASDAGGDSAAGD